MDVEVVRDGYKYGLHFEKGENVGGLQKEETGGRRTYSKTTWKPDREVFTDINVPLSYYTETLKRQAIVNAGLLFFLSDEESGEQHTFRYENGIRDYIAELTEKTSFTKIKYLTHETVGRDQEDRDEYKLKFEIAFCFDNEVNVIEYYHNSSWLEYGGSPDKALRAAFTYAVDNYIKGAGLYKKDEKKLTFSDIEDSLTFISNSFSTIISFENQTKKSITNKFIQDAMTEFIKKQLEIYFIENKSEADKIANQTLVNKRSRETAEKTRVAIRKKLTGGMDFTNRVEKYVDCRTKKVEERELYIVEGDSALGACKLGRDPEFQAIMPVRGKILNCLKADYNKIFASEIITNLIKVLGCGIEVRTKHHRDQALNSFDLGKLNFAKVIICTDGDVDGFHIRTQVLAMLYRLTPTLIHERKVYIAESPLYEITGAKKTYFAYSDRERNDITSKLTGKFTIQRSKGLGENEPEMMWQTTMSPETRKLIQVLPGDAEKARETFELMLGDNVKGRKSFIEEFGYKYIDVTELG